MHTEIWDLKIFEFGATSHFFHFNYFIYKELFKILRFMSEIKHHEQ